MLNGNEVTAILPVKDMARARRFYSELLGWQTSEMEGFPDYYLFSFGEIKSAGGAIGLRGQATGTKMRVYAEVDSIDALLPKVAGLGGTVKEGRTEIPGQGWYAVIDDPEGNELGLYEGLPSD